MIRQIANFIKLVKAVRRRELKVLGVYITEKCNSHCRICHMWKKKDPKDMTLGMFEGILGSIDRDKTTLVIEGGEPLLHPRIGEILGELKRGGFFYNIVSNGILAEKLYQLVKEYDTPGVVLSCDGLREAYKRIRGIDNFNNIAWLAERLPQLTPTRINYVICPWNTREDLLGVKELCDRFGITLDISIYGDFEYWDTDTTPMREIYKADDLDIFPGSLLLRLYPKWASGKLRLPCHTMRISCTVIPDGTVCLCAHKFMPLGNINAQPLMDVWRSDEAERVHLEYVDCNDCWARCYRHLDVTMALLNPRYIGRILL